MSNVPPERRRAPGVRRTRFALVAASMLALCGAGTAHAASPVTDFYGGPITDSSPCNAAGSGVVASTGASTNTDFCIAYSTQTNPETPIEADDLKSQVIDTPRGFAANAGGVPTCAVTGPDGFNADTSDDVGCTTASQVGSATSDIRTQIQASGISLPIALGAVPGRVYSLTPSDSEVALLGIVLDPVAIVEQPKVKVLVRVTLRPAPDVGLRSIIDNLPRQAEVLPPAGPPSQIQPLAVDTFNLKFWGSKAAHPTLPVDFGFLGSDCTTDQATSLRAISYDGTPTAADAAPYRLTNCDNAAIPFAPSAEYTTTENRPDVTTASQVNVRFGVSTTPGVVASTVKRTVVTLPDGLALSGQIASGADGLPLCSAAQFAQTSAAAATCPAATAVGAVRLTSPALNRPLTGQAFLGPQPSTGALPDLYIQAQLGTGDDAPRVKLIGSLEIDGQNRIVTTLDDLPQVPVSEFALTFRGGDHSVLVTPPTCGTFTGSLSATPHTRPTTPSTSEQSYSVSDDCGAVSSFSPGVAFGVDDPNSAGKSSPLTVVVARPDRSPRLASTSINLPPGMLATLKGVPECGGADAAAGTCPASTRVGSITGVAGVGPAPFSAPGDVFLTERRNGAVAGLVFRVPIVFGGVDLGVLNVPAVVSIRASDQGLRVDADVPERFKGIPLNLRSLSIRLDRAGFPLSPTSCAPLNTASTITATTGAVAYPTAGLKMTGCDALPFNPGVDTAVSGATQQGGRPFTQVRVQSPAGSSALRQAYVTLPAGLGFDLKQLPRSCELDDFAASRCPEVAKIGAVGGLLSITDDPLGGNLYLLKPQPGQTLPGLGLAFQGRFQANIVGENKVNTKTGQLVTQFASLPDIPLTSFQIDVAGGSTGVLIATSELCANPVDFQARFVSSTGKGIDKTSRRYCGMKLGEELPKISGRVGGVRKGRPTVSLSITAPAKVGATKAKSIRRVDLDLPSAWTLSTTRAKSESGVALKNLTEKGSTSSRRVGKRTLRLTLPSAGTTKVKILTRTGTVSIASTSARRTKTKLAFEATITYTDGTKTVAPVRLTPR